MTIGVFFFGIYMQKENLVLDFGNERTFAAWGLYLMLVAIFSEVSTKRSKS